MQHCDEQTLGLMALGERAPSAADEHLAACARCRADLESLRAVVSIARSDAAPARVPPSSVWAGIAAATGVSATPRQAEVERHAAPPAAPELAPRSHLVSVDEPDTSQPAHVVGRRAHRRDAGPRRRWAPLLGVAAAGLVVGGIGGLLASGALDDDSSPTPSTSPLVLASAQLAALEAAPGASGEARVLETSTGRVLEVDVSSLAAPDGFYAVWLIDASVQKMVPIGILQGATGEFAIPDDLDLGQYPVVDVSIEPLDGDPLHSGSSVLRGTIST